MTLPVVFSSLEDKPILCLFSWAGGRLDIFSDLILHLENDCSIYGFPIRGIENEASPHLTLEQMALDYLETLAPVLGQRKVVLGWRIDGR